MKPTLFIRSGVLAACALLSASEASAVAQIGGTVFLVGGSPNCNKSLQVPLNTPQDTFALSLSTACDGGSALGELSGNASTTSVGLHVAVSSPGPFGQAAAEVGLTDLWTIGVPLGMPIGTVFTLPVAFRLEGDVSPGATFGAAFGRFLDYSISLSQFGSASGFLQRTGQVVSTGHFDQTFAGPVSFTNFGPTLTIADFEMQLFVPDLTQGDIDFLHTLSASVTLPPGFTATSSSGVPLFVTSTVPEPESMWLLGLGIVSIASMRIKRKRSREDRRPPVNPPVPINIP